MTIMRNPKNILVTGGAGFIGSSFIRFLIQNPDFQGNVINYDLLTYAANLENLKGVAHSKRYRFFQGNILDAKLLEKIFLDQEIDTVVHFAAETHVDRSIDSPGDFIETNINGTYVLLELMRKFPHIHFHHISTDEVYGSLGEGGSFSEHSQIRPNSPYAASKAASDHLVRAYAHTYGISSTVSHCSNNYGPCQYPEKLIPLMILNALNRKPLPIYGNGANVREWLFVDDHARAVWEILLRGKNREVYDIGGTDEVKNSDLVHLLLKIIAEETGQNGEALTSLIRYVPDRPGHDFRYSIDDAKIRRELGWEPKVDLKEGLKKTVRWYVKNRQAAPVKNF
jgi:dTDP-glucose 4,6-dehydratase